MNLKNILDRISVVVRGRFAGNANSWWIMQFADVLGQVDKLCAGPGRMVTVNVLPMDSGFIPMPPYLVDVCEVFVDEVSIPKYDKNSKGVWLDSDVIDTFTKESTEFGSAYCNGTRLSVVTSDADLQADNGLAGWTMYDRAWIAKIHSSAGGVGDLVYAYTTEPVQSFDAGNLTAFKSNVVFKGHKATNPPASLTEEIDCEDGMEALFAAGLWWKAELDMDPSSPHAVARYNVFLDEIKKYLAMQNHTNGTSGKKSFQFTVRRDS